MLILKRTGKAGLLLVKGLTLASAGGGLEEASDRCVVVPGKRFKYPSPLTKGLLMKVFNWLPNKLEYSSMPFKSGKPCMDRNPYTARPKNSWSCWHFSIGAPQVPSHELCSAEQVLPRGTALWDETDVTKHSIPPAWGVPMRIVYCVHLSWQTEEPTNELIQPSVTAGFIAEIGYLFAGFVCA